MIITRHVCKYMRTVDIFLLFQPCQIKQQTPWIMNWDLEPKKYYFGKMRNEVKSFYNVMKTFTISGNILVWLFLCLSGYSRSFSTN